VCADASFCKKYKTKSKGAERDLSLGLQSLRVLCVNVCMWSPRRVVRGLSVALLFLLVVFCGGQRFSFVRVAWSLGGLAFFAVLEVLSLLGGVWGLVFDESLGLVVSGVISGEVLGLCIRVAIGRQVASVSRRGCLGSRRVHPSSHLRIPNGLAVGVVLGSGAG
jgi:hypothetical protein